MKATLCRERRPRRSAAGAIRHAPRPANSQPSHCRERACPFRAAHGQTWESPGECATRLRIRPGLAGIGRFLPEGASPFPTGRRLRIRLMLWKTWVSLRGALGSARPTGLMRIRPTWCFGFVLLRGTPGTAFPTERLRIRRAFIENPPLLRGRRDAAPYKVSACFPPFPSPSGGRWHPPIPREADDGRGRT